ncbi:MAG: Rieske 2Fe-2S domain-containing protein [Mariprofundales bacterium]
MAEWIDVIAVEKLATITSPYYVDTWFGRVAVFYHGIEPDGQWLAIEDACSHDGGALACGKINGDEIICPRHGARFCLHTGKVLSPPAYEDIRTFTVRLHNEMVQVDIDD